MLSWFAQDTSLYSYDYEYSIDTTTSATGLAIFGGVWLLFWLAIAVVAIIAMWKIFVKAGQPGWAAIIPIYNVYIMLKIIGRPGWWILLFFVPLVNFIVSIVVALDLGKSFGKDPVFSIVLLWLFSIIGYLILGFGSDKYVGPGGQSAAPAAPAGPTPPPAA
jgi:hypothetical protein